MTWAKLLANNKVTRQHAAKKELDNLRSIVSRSLKHVPAPGLSADARFIMAYDAARTLSLMIVRSSDYRPKAAGGHYNTFLRSKQRTGSSPSSRLISMAAASSATLANMILRAE
jgi:hypothetical protein